MIPLNNHIDMSAARFQAVHPADDDSWDHILKKATTKRSWSVNTKKPVEVNITLLYKIKKWTN